MSTVASSVGGSGGDVPEDRNPKRGFDLAEKREEEEEEEEEGKGEKRGRKNRGGKKAKKQAILRQSYELGTHVPKSEAKAGRRVPKVGELQCGHPIVSVKENPVEIRVLSEQTISLVDRVAALQKARGLSVVVPVPKPPPLGPPPGWTGVASSSSVVPEPKVGPSVPEPKVGPSVPSSPSPSKAKAKSLPPPPSRAVSTPSSGSIAKAKVSQVAPKGSLSGPVPSALTAPPSLAPSAKGSGSGGGGGGTPGGSPPGSDPSGVPAALRPVIREGRISLDFHNVLDVGFAGDRGVDTIHHLNRAPLERFLETVSQLGFR